jgi:hypothetical protein
VCLGCGTPFNNRRILLLSLFLLRWWFLHWWHLCVVLRECLLQVLVHALHNFGEELTVEEGCTDRVVLRNLCEVLKNWLFDF